MSAAEIISLYAIAAIWFMMILNVILSIGGFIYIYRCNKSDGNIPMDEKDYPMVSILVPAHNEALVLKRTVQALLSFDYPKEKYEIIVVNDNSSDNTEEILSDLAASHPDHRLICLSTDKVVGGTGKSNALNIGYSIAKGSVIAIYDADNTPEKPALRLLVENLMADEKLGAVIGKFRTRNRNASILSRFVNIETLSHQCTNQAGRYFFFRLCTIPGTNYVIRRDIIEKVGGWDVKALSEDTEISFRIYRMGYYIKLLPQAVTWEQEPHLLPIWFKQRVRWAKGNIYVMIKNFKYTFDKEAGAMRFDTLYYALVYSIMLTSLIASDMIFLGGMLGLVTVKLGGFTPMLWGMAIVVFVANIMLTLSLEKNEFSLESLGLATLMLFTYAKLWVVVVAKAAWDSTLDAVLKREVKWDKTVRYVETASEQAPAVKNNG
ncbi:MAG: glycosyltransferase family 2 protein [Solobacterium sp.]|nr:glycosyltransferase family 2 protein [Solobacterium sp.]